MPPEAQPPVFSFERGVLHVATPHLAKMRIQWRPVPTAEELAPGASRWRPFWPDFRLLRPLEPQVKEPAYPLDFHAIDLPKDAPEQKAAAFAAFRAEVTPDIVRAVELFGNHQWALMAMLHEQPLAMDLAVNNPVLAYSLANSSELRGSPQEAAAVQALWYCNRKQRAILAWLGFPGTEAMVRLLRRIPPASASPSILRRLRNIIASDLGVLQLLAHLRVVNSAVLELVTNERLLNLVTPKLLIEIAENDPEPGQLSVGDMLLGSLALLQEIAPRRVITPFSSVQQIVRFREDVDEEYPLFLARQQAARQAALRDAVQQRRLIRARANETPWRRQEREQEAVRQIKAYQEQLARRMFPPAPIPGTSDIIPLTSANQLRTEGKEQHNCVRTYAERVLAGATYVYQVLAPERATLAIVLGEDGGWHCSELKATCNKPVMKATAARVAQWLDQFRVSV